ncbi:MAG: FkbM family methyltransferase [Pseudomonadota bacterium]
MKQAVSQTPALGTYAPPPLTAALLALSRNTPLGRGGARKLLGRAIASMTGEAPLDVSLYGLHARLYQTGNLSETKALLKPSHYSRNEFAFCRRTMPAEGGVFFDIGGNAGVFSLFVASLMRSGTLISAEPQPDMYQRLTANFDLNPEVQARLRIHLQQTAIGGSAPSELTLSIPDSAGQASGRPVEGMPTLTVPMIPLLDAIIDAGVEHVDLLKIDVEGFEDAVLIPFFETSPESLWPKAIVMEYCHASQWETDCEAMLIKNGYSVAQRDKANVMLQRA